MAEMRRAVAGGGLYERLLPRLALALEEADTAGRLRDAPPSELELRGLSHAEFEVIKAYLETLPERQNACAGSYPQAEPTSAKIIWLKDKKRPASTARSRTLPHR